MIYVSLAAIGGLVIVALAQAGMMARVTRQHARERDALLNKIMHLAGRTWEPPPADVGHRNEREPDRYTVMPEQDSGL